MVDLILNEMKIDFYKHYFDEVFKIENSELDSRGEFERVFCREN